VALVDPLGQWGSVSISSHGLVDLLADIWKDLPRTASSSFPHLRTRGIHNVAIVFIIAAFAKSLDSAARVTFATQLTTAEVWVFSYMSAG
jgi:hypothetical protein